MAKPEWDGILDALVTALSTPALPGVTFVGLDRELPWEADQLSAIIIDSATATIRPAPLTEFTYPVQVIYLHALRPEKGPELLQPARAMVRPIFERLAGRNQLGGIVNSILFRDDRSVEVGITEKRNREYIGFTMHLLVTEKFGVTFTP